jgi:hypothetical protein
VPCESITLYTEGIPNQLTSKYSRQVFFDYNGREWECFVYSERDKTEEVDLVFEHFINTFEPLP